MTIGVDGNEANVPHKVGVSMYTFELLHYFKSKANADTRFIVYLRSSPDESMPTENNYFRYEIVKGSRLWSQIFFPIHLLTHKKPDILFCPAHYAPRFCPVKTVVAIHDLAYFYYPDEFLKKDLYQLKNWTRYSMDKATKIIAVSKTTKKDLLTFYNEPESKIQVIYNGFRKQTTNNKPSSNHKPQTTNYFLYVGTIQPRKNITTLISAFSILLKQYPDYQLYLVGRKGWLYESIFEKVKELEMEKNVIFTGFIDNNSLDTLYSNATCFVFPSLYEGFGIPLLEAMDRGCPVISSFNSSLPEVGGEACLYFDPTDAQGIADDMIDMITNKKLRQDLVKKGKDRVQLFSWQKCGEQTLELLKNT
jgi:glycosyltransferase involved in cell wall biosynthesis